MLKPPPRNARVLLYLIIGSAVVPLQLMMIILLLYSSRLGFLLLLTIMVRIIIPWQSKSILEVISTWLTRNNRPIVMIVSLVFGCLLFE